LPITQLFFLTIYQIKCLFDVDIFLYSERARFTEHKSWINCRDDTSEYSPEAEVLKLTLSTSKVGYMKILSKVVVTFLIPWGSLLIFIFIGFYG